MITKLAIGTVCIIGVLSLVAVACGETIPTPIGSTVRPTPTPEQENVELRFDVGPCRMTRAAQLPIEFEYAGTVPTGFDGINQATCTFTKPVEKVTVVLTGPATHTEIFTLDEPRVEVAFPLPEGILSITTQEIVPPGEYQREMTVTSVDGETLVISGQRGFLNTVTILEPSS